jgi:hypothetical protein
LRAQVRIRLDDVGPHFAVSTPLASCMLSLNRTPLALTQSADTNASSAWQEVGQPFDAHVADVTERTLVPAGPGGPGGPGGPSLPGGPCNAEVAESAFAPASPGFSLQLANASVAAIINIRTGTRIFVLLNHPPAGQRHSSAPTAFSKETRSVARD